MKKILTVVVLFAALMTAVPAKAEVKFGLKGGLNLTSMSLDANAISKSNQAGFFVGPTVKFTLPIVGLGFDASALYDQRSAEVGNEKIKQQSIQIPVNLRYNIGIGGSAGIYLAAGPQFGFPVGDKVYNTKVGEYRLKDANLSFNFGAGVYLLKHLEVGFAYNLAAGKSGEFSGWNDVDTHNNAWQIGAAVYF